MFFFVSDILRAGSVTQAICFLCALRGLRSQIRRGLQKHSPHSLMNSYVHILDGWIDDTFVCNQLLQNMNEQ
jgi:hypothetical protein